MDYFHHVAGKHRPRPQRHTSSSRYRDWEPRHDFPLDSLPYRTLKPEVQRPDDRKLKHSSHRRTPLSEDLHVRGPMPPQPQLLIRSSTVAHKGPKGRLPYDADDDDDDDEGEDEEDDDDDDDDGGEEQRLRARLRSRSRTRTRARTRSMSSSRDSDSVVMTTPTRSTHAYRSAPVSRHVSSASEGSSSADSSSSESTQDARKRPRSRSLKERMQVPAVPDPISAIEEPPPRRRRHGRRGRNIVHLEHIHAEPEYEEPDTVDLKPASTSRHRVQSESRSRSRRQHRHLDHYSEGHPTSSSRRPTMRRYYESDAGYPPRTLLPRSHHTSRSRIPSRSVSTSSRRSSFLGGFFAPAIHQHPSDKPTKTVECIVCLDDLPASQAPKLKCGHRMCKTCLKRIFKISIKDPQQMPPRCCTSECIPLKHVDKIFKDDFKRIWNRKFAEFSTRNRVYCPGKKCGEWIKPDQIHRHRNGRKIAKCSKCGTRVCCACNNKWHESKHCPADDGTDLILQQAKEHGWQRCFRCKDMVELKEGCNHMTCRCGAEFCMICGAKWKTCECPWFSYDTAEHDGLDDMDIPVPMVDRDRLGGSDTFPNYRAGTTTPGQGARFRPTTYEEEMHIRHAQEQQDEELARRLQYEDTDDEYLDGVGDVMGVGNATGHFMNDNYRRAQSVIAPQPPPAAPMSTFERANSTVTDYVTGVKRSRGFRSSSMERRLADRFEQRQNSNPTHRAFGASMPPPPHAPRSMGPPPPPQPPGMPTNGMRRHTVEDDIYDPSRNPRLAERMTPRRAATQDYLEQAGVYAPTSRRRHRDREPPRDSVLAGLTGQGRGMNRVFEWRNHVEPNSTEHHITAS